jgi:hypothetical protein
LTSAIKPALTKRAKGLQPLVVKLSSFVWCSQILTCQCTGKVNRVWAQLQIDNRHVGNCTCFAWMVREEYLGKLRTDLIASGMV